MILRWLWLTYVFLCETFFRIVSLFTKKGPPGDEGAQTWIQHVSSLECQIIEGKTLNGIVIRRSNVVLRNCTINGSVRIMGLAKNGESPSLRAQSRTTGYVNWVRSTAPTNVVIENCVITGKKSIPLYIAPGVTKTTIKNTLIQGKSVSTLVYFDAESHGNVLESCIIDGSLIEREAIAIDSSDHNVLMRNTIKFGKHGGIKLYRNCGLNGNIRHTTPSYNVIEENVFKPVSHSRVAVYIGSRAGGRVYCCCDKGYPFGSSQSDLDHSRYNKVIKNRLNGSKIIERCGHSNVIKENR